jgi:hypothetical protein
MTRFLRILSLIAATAAAILGQDHAKRELFGTIGIAKTYDDEGSLGTGLHGGGGFGYRFTRRLGAEVEVTGFRTRREFGSAYPAFQASGAMVLGNGLLYLSRGRAEWYLTGGAGMLHIRNHIGFSGVPVNLADDGLAVDLGTGIKIHASSHFVLRPEVRLFAGNGGRAVEAPFSGVRVSMTAGFCW